MSNSSTAELSRKRQLRATAGAFVGTAIEWYDFFIFGTAAALAFGTVFYPDIDPNAGLLASFATFWVGFIARPIGGVVFGHLGDKFGRKNTLVFTLVLMGLATSLIGLLPGYATIGIWSPIALIFLRACQGLAVGGEWGGAVLMATENAPARKKGFVGSWVQQGSPAGSILATLMFLLVGGLPDDAFISWGWRVPFLFSAVLLIIALVIRLKVEESAEFEEVKRRDEVVKLPALEVFRRVPWILTLAVFASIAGIASAFFNNTFLVSWSTTGIGMDRQVVLNVMLIVAIVQFVWQPLAALLAERWSAVVVMLLGLVLNIAMIIPLYLSVLAGDSVMMTIFLALSVIGGAAHYSLLAGLLSEAFPPNIRYSGVAIANGLCASIIGGSTPLIAQSLLSAGGGSPVGVGIFNTALIVLTMLGVYGLNRVLTRSGRGMQG